MQILYGNTPIFVIVLPFLELYDTNAIPALYSPSKACHHELSLPGGLLSHGGARSPHDPRSRHGSPGSGARASV